MEDADVAAQDSLVAGHMGRLEAGAQHVSRFSSRTAVSGAQEAADLAWIGYELLCRMGWGKGVCCCVVRLSAPSADKTFVWAVIGE